MGAGYKVAVSRAAPLRPLTTGVVAAHRTNWRTEAVRPMVLALLPWATRVLSRRGGDSLWNPKRITSLERQRVKDLPAALELVLGPSPRITRLWMTGSHMGTFVNSFTQSDRV